MPSNELNFKEQILNLKNIALKPEGVQLIKFIHEITGLNTQSFNYDSPLATAYRCGMREVSLKINEYLASTILVDEDTEDEIYN